MTSALSHLRTRRQRLAWLVLPALLLRSLIPAGFMPIAGTGGAILGFCPGAGALPQASTELAQQASHFTHTHHDGGAPAAPGTHHHPVCIFSGGATTEFAAVLLPALAATVSQAPGERAASLVFLPAILRAQSSRGPPFLA